MIGHRTRAALEREKLMTLRALKELEFDRAMGKLSDADWQEMSARLRARATGLIRQLDSGGGYRQQIERDLATRLAAAPAETIAQKQTDRPESTVATGNFCTECGTKNEADAKFCKNCGHRL
jgi:membrane protease subunit (stomatin/prohibitin family)